MKTFKKIMYYLLTLLISFLIMFTALYFMCKDEYFHFGKGEYSFTEVAYFEVKDKTELDPVISFDNVREIKQHELEHLKGVKFKYIPRYKSVWKMFFYLDSENTMFFLRIGDGEGLISFYEIHGKIYAELLTDKPGVKFEYNCTLFEVENLDINVLEAAYKKSKPIIFVSYFNTYFGNISTKNLILIFVCITLILEYITYRILKKKFKQRPVKKKKGKKKKFKKKKG